MVNRCRFDELPTHPMPPPPAWGGGRVGGGWGISPPTPFSADLLLFLHLFPLGVGGVGVKIELRGKEVFSWAARDGDKIVRGPPSSPPPVRLREASRPRGTARGLGGGGGEPKVDGRGRGALAPQGVATGSEQ